MRKKLCIIFIVAAILGVINAVVIFNLTHQYSYAADVVPAIMAMSGDDKIIIVDSKQNYSHFTAYTKDHNATDYIIYMLDNIPDDLNRAWIILDKDSPKQSEDPNDLLPNFHVISEIINSDYSAYELEKL